jgi:hypothetical protein
MEELAHSVGESDVSARQRASLPSRFIAPEGNIARIPLALGLLVLLTGVTFVNWKTTWKPLGATSTYRPTSNSGTSFWQGEIVWLLGFLLTAIFSFFARRDRILAALACIFFEVVSIALLISAISVGYGSGPWWGLVGAIIVLATMCRVAWSMRSRHRDSSKTWYPIQQGMTPKETDAHE